MKTINQGVWMLGLSILVLYSSAEASTISMTSKPVTSAIGYYQAPFSPIVSGDIKSLEGSKPVLLILGETPRTTLTVSHIRREGWRYKRNPFQSTKPVIEMLSR